MAETYKNLSEEELQNKYNSLKTDEEKKAFLEDYTKYVKLTHSESINLEKEAKRTQSYIDAGASESVINEIEESLEQIETNSNSTLEDDPRDAVLKLEKALGKALPQSASNAPRFHVARMLSADPKADIDGTGINGYFIFQINKKPTGPMAALADEVINIEDVSAGAPFTGTYTMSYGNWRELRFNPVYHGNSCYVEIRKDIKVTWISGHTEIFTMYYMPECETYPISGTGWGNSGKGHNPIGCNDWYQDPFLRYRPDSNWVAPITNTSSTITRLSICEVLDNPGGNFEPFELVSEYPVYNSGQTNMQIFGWHQATGVQSLVGNPQWFSPDMNESGKQLIRITERNIWSSASAKVHHYGNVALNTAAEILASSYGSGYTTTNYTYGGWESAMYSNTGNMYADAAAFRASVVAIANSQTPGGSFTTHMVYAENLSPCGNSPAPNSYDVCLTPGTPDYYLTTCKDCNGNNIPANECNGTVSAIFNDGQCCTDCSTFIPALNTVDASNGGQDGIIEWDLANPSGSATPGGTPWSSGSMYTVTITASNAATLPTQAPVGGAVFTTSVTTNVSAGTEHLVTVTSNQQIAPGMQISVPGNTQIPTGTYVGAITSGTQQQNAIQFSLVDNLGNSVNATAAATVTGTFATGFEGSFGYLLPNTAGGLGTSTFYTITFTDDAGCTESFPVIIGEADPISGCTDGSTPALNYDATAVTDDGSCIYCDAVTGDIVDPSGQLAGSLYSSQTVGILDATVNASFVPQSDGSVSLTTTMANNPALLLQTDGTQTYTFTLHSLANAGAPSTTTGVVATETGIAVTTFGSSPSHTFTSLSYGHYGIKVELVDNSEDHGLEPCYEWFFGTVKVPVCNNTSATNYNSSSVPADFIISTPSLCQFTSICCNVGSILEDTSRRGTLCSPFLYVDISCDPYSTNISGYWTFNGVQIPNSAFNIGGVGGPDEIWLMDNNTQASLFTGSGTYNCVITQTFASQADCTETVSGSFTLPVCDCTDPTAINYNPLATIDDGSCIYPSWDCNTGVGCYDPGTGSGQYPTQSACQAACPISTLGCTDPCATNFNASANVDDGSCTFKACLNPAAANYQYSCDCNQQIVSATISDPSCCSYPCAVGMTIQTYAANASGSCTAPIQDGDIGVGVQLNNAATLYQVDYYDATGTTLICSDPTWYPNFTGANWTTTVSNLCPPGVFPGVYLAKVVDNLGCTGSKQITVGTMSVTQGCTDPTAQNYDPTALCDDGSCLYCGCTDPLANNYNPNAACDDGSCKYPVIQNTCIPPNIEKRKREITACLSEKGSKWLYKYKIGTADDCTLMNKWKLILIQYLLSDSNLTCVFNCADEDSPDLSTIQSCAPLAIAGGPVTGTNDQGHAGSTYSSTTGTVITNPTTYFVLSNTLFTNDVITMPSGLVWQMVSPGNCTWGCYNPETSQGASSGHWKQCVPSNNITITTTVNYIDNFINFANKYCRDCKISLLGSGIKK